MEQAASRIEDVDRAANAIFDKQGKPKFAQVYERGWNTIDQISENRTALRVWVFIAKNCDHLNALVCSVELMAEELELSTRTIIRATKWLEKHNHLVIMKIGTANAYHLDHHDLWKNYERYKGYCGFHANTLVSKKQNKTLKRRLTHMQGQQDLFDAETGEIKP